jgi:hypothetical protein
MPIPEKYLAQLEEGKLTMPSFGALVIVYF